MVQSDYALVARYDEGDVDSFTSQDLGDRRQSESQKIPTVVIHDETPILSTEKQVHNQFNHQTRFWNPIWLSKKALIGFTAIFTTLTIAVLALYVASRMNSGLSTQTPSYQYAWTYGPTAVIVLVTSLWLHVEYWCKEMAPWSRMRSGPTPTETGILADYFTSNVIVTLGRSFKQKDAIVWLAVCGGLLLHGATVFATSLILLEPTLVTHPAQLQVLEGLVSAVPNLPATMINGDPLVIYYGTQAKNLSYPAGTTDNLFVETLSPVSGSSDNGSYSGVVSGISVDLECEPVTTPNITRQISQPWSSVLAPFWSVNITTPNCTINGIIIGEGVGHAMSYTSVTSVYQGWWGNYTCNDGVQNDMYPQFYLKGMRSRPVVAGFDDHRLIMTTSYLQWTANATGNVTRKSWLQNFSMIMCKPSYTILDYEVTDSQQATISISPRPVSNSNTTSRRIKGLGNDDLVPLLRNATFYSGLKDGSYLSSYATDSYGYLPPTDPFWVLMAKMTNSTGLSALSNPSTLLEVGPKAISGTLTQVFQEWFTESTERQINGTVSEYVNRLNVKVLPAAAMMTLLGILACISIILIFIRPSDAVPCKPDTIAAKAKILATSPALYMDMQRCNGGTPRSIALKLKDFHYQTVVNEQDSSFQIHSKDGSLNLMEQASSIGSQQTSQWWKPINHQIWFGGLLVVIAAVIVAALEILQNRSNSEGGILEFSDIGSAHLLINLIPATILVGVALLFSMLHFDTTIIAPYNALRKGAIPHTRGVTVSVLGKTSPHALFLSLKHRLFAPCFSAVAVMIASFLTIVVTGLYHIENVTITGQLQVRRTDSFNFTKQDLYVYDDGAAAVTKLIEYQNLSYPAWTYDNLVFPKLDIDSAAGMSNGSLLTLEIPAIKPSLECYISDPGQSYIRRNTTVYKLNNYVDSYVQSTIDLLCPSNNGSICSISWSVPIPIPITASNTTIGGISSVGYPSKNNALQIGNPAFVVALGKISARAPSNTTLIVTDYDVYGLVCYQHLQEVQAKVVFDMPGMRISTSSPPTIMDNTARDLVFSSDSYNGTRYSNSVQTLMDSFATMNNEDFWYGGFIQALTQSRINANIDIMLGTQGAPYLVEAVQKLYATYMVQAIDGNFRVPAITSISSPSPSTYEGTLSQPHANRQRLKQHPKTKIVLQVMLLVMMTCAILTFVLSDWKTILPSPPCSIAGTMILLAGSDMASRALVPEGSEWTEDDSLWEGWQFSLGWWGEAGCRRFGIDVGRAEGGR